MTAILMSGGMDSVALAALCKPAHAITIDYGQLAAEGEIRAAAAVSELLGIHHHLIRVDCRQLGSGDLAGTAAISLAPVPEWWPYRNQLLATLAATKAVTLGVKELLFGTVLGDAVHVDGTADFFRHLDAVIAMQEGHLRIRVPAIGMSTVDLVRESKIERSVLAWSHSCHTASYACGLCRGCQKHLSVLRELGYADGIQ